MVLVYQRYAFLFRFKMNVATLLALVSCLVGAMAYMPGGKDHFLTDSLLREVVDRMGRDLAESYLDYPSSGANGHLSMASLMSRADKDLEDSSFYPDSPNPSIRDQEYIQHSTLWGHHYLTGGNGEGKNRLTMPGGGALKIPTSVKSDASLPAYCNPPNPCPIGFAANDGCLEEFENTAAFSREYQASQDCMCDSEHMFDCSESDREQQTNDLQEADLDRLVQRFQVDDQHKNLVAKKFHVKKDKNPFLEGEKLPIAAKKGLNVVY